LHRDELLSPESGSCPLFVKREIRRKSASLNLTVSTGLMSCVNIAKHGSVLDVEMTILDKQSKSVPIDEQANDDVVHLDRFREADRLTNQALTACP
jgi:hypothetical protein